MTTACAIFLGISLLFYCSATLLFQGHFLLRRSHWESWGRRALHIGISVHVLGLVLHFLISGQSPFSNMLVVVSLLVIALLVAGLLVEHYSRVHHLGLLLSPLAFLGTLYPVLMPVQFEGAESILLRYPWLGVHVFITMLGLAGLPWPSARPSPTWFRRNSSGAAGSTAACRPWTRRPALLTTLPQPVFQSSLWVW